MSLEVLQNNIVDRVPSKLWTAFGTEVERLSPYKLELPLWTGALAVPKYIGEVQTPEGLYVPDGAQISLEVQNAILETGPDATQAPTFRIAPYIFDKAGLKNHHEVARTATLEACRIADEARLAAQERTGKKIAVAGTIGPLEDCYTPKDTPTNEELEKWHPSQIANLREAYEAGYIDYVQAETFPTLREAMVVATALREAKLPFAISFYCDNGVIASGTDTWEQAIDGLLPLKPLFIGPNCGSMEDITIALTLLSETNKGRIPMSAFANGPAKKAQHPTINHAQLALLSPDGWDTNAMLRNAHGRMHAEVAAGLWIDQLGVAAVGACCGSDANYTKQLAQRLAW